MAQQKNKRAKESLSYRKLQKMIQTYHPVDPITNRKFNVLQSITVKNYALKLTDCLGCWLCNRCLKYFGKKCYGLVKRGNTKKKMEKPESMKDVPSSDNSSDEDFGPDTFKGLSEASKNLGEGAILYLQNMKTFAVLFFILAVVNLPIYWMYSLSTKDNSYNLFHYDP